MRLWSLDPKYLDSKGLVALWREGLLARKVLKKETKAYSKHPQLSRFLVVSNPLNVIDAYLTCVLKEAQNRGYNFNKNKIFIVNKTKIITVTNGQVEYEFKHLMQKLKLRDPMQYQKYSNLYLKNIRINPIFRLVQGKVEDWERL